MNYCKHALRRKAPRIIRGMRINLENKNFGFIYVLDLGIDGLYKIGKTINPEARIKDLQAANPKLTVIILQRVKHYHDCEKYIHRCLCSWKIKREIFRLTDEHLELIRLFLNEFTEQETAEGFDLTNGITSAILNTT